MIKMHSYIIHWLTGENELVTGESISEAFTNAGHGAGAVKAVDWYEEIDN